MATPSMLQGFLFPASRALMESLIRSITARLSATDCSGNISKVKKLTFYLIFIHSALTMQMEACSLSTVHSSATKSSKLEGTRST